MYDDDGGCLGALIALALIAMFFEVIKWIGVGAIVIAVIALVVFIVRRISTNIKTSEKERAKKEELRLIEDEKKDDETRKKLQEESARISKDKEAYTAYNAALYESQMQDNLNEATELIDKMISDDDDIRKPKILTFLDKYLPLMTDMLNASIHDDIDLEEATKTFTETILNFYKNLYKIEDTIDNNQTILENMAIRDGLIDPYDISVQETE